MSGESSEQEQLGGVSANETPGLPLVSELLGILAHDLRNPIAALLSNVGYLNMLGRALPDDVRETIVDLELSIEALGRMTHVLELLAGEVTNSGPRPWTTFALSTVFDALWAPAERAAESHGVRLERTAFGSERVESVESSVQGALSALIHNAIMCAPPRSTVRVSSEIEGENLVIAIEDDGPQLAVPYRGSAFTSRGPVETKGKLEGRYSRGLGLYVAGREVLLARAQLRVQNPARGNRFELVLRRARS
jgi:K+-sensing histidine kinase KdpD